MDFKIDDLMSRHPITARYKDELSSAYLRMKREGFRHMPVIDDSGKVIGIISDRDFQRAMWPHEDFDMQGLPSVPQFQPGSKVSDFMSWPVKSLPEDANLLQAIEMMIDNKISAILVNRGDQATGILTHEDLLRILASILRKPSSLEAGVMKLAYNTPLGKVADMLATAGI